MVPEDQLEEITAALDAAGVRYWTDGNSISLDEEPFISIINFDAGADASAIQKIIDSI